MSGNFTKWLFLATVSQVELEFVILAFAVGGKHRTQENPSGQEWEQMTNSTYMWQWSLSWTLTTMVGGEHPPYLTIPAPLSHSVL